jgi:DNA (cytosine-5)-methyltransferase 1
LLPSIPEGRNYLWHTDRGDGKSLFGYRTRFWSFLLKLAKDKPAWTLAAQPGPGTGPFHWENRPLAIEEMLALQTFPWDWKLAGGYRDGTRLVGNATPPLLAERLGRSLLTALGVPAPTAALTYLHGRAPRPPPPAALEEVAPEYEKLIQPYPAHAGAGLGPKPRAVAQNTV